MRLVRYNPLNERFFFRNAFNDFYPESKPNTGQCFSPAVDVVNKEDYVELNVALPGMKKEDIVVNIEDKVLTISGERKLEHEDTRENYYRREISYGGFKRAFTLSDEILTEEVRAEYTDGILKIILKKDTVKEEVKQITVN